MDGTVRSIPIDKVYTDHPEEGLNAILSPCGNNEHDSSDGEGNMNVEEKRGKVLEARRKWALIHFYSLRPAFSVSMILYLASMTSGRGALSFRSGIIDPIRNLASLVRMESNAYANCVQLHTNRTARYLDHLAKEDRECAREILESNRKILERVEDAANGCLRDSEKVRELLVHWRQDGMDIPWNEVTLDTVAHLGSCTAEKRNQAEEVLGQDHRAAKIQMNSSLETFVSESHNSLKIVSDYALERFDYDWEYFIEGRIRPALDFLTKYSVSIQATGIDISYNITEIEERLHGQARMIENKFKEAKEHVHVLQIKLEEFRGSINGLYVNYNELYNRMVTAAQTISEFLPPGIALPDVFDISDFHLADSFLPPTGLVWPELEMDYADIQQVSQDVTQACLDLLVKILDDTEVQSLQGLRETIQSLAQPLIEILELQNYRPPQFQGSRPGIIDIDHELEFHSYRGEKALNWTAQAMIDLRERSSVFHNFTTEEIEVPMIGIYTYNNTEETPTTFELLDILMPDFSFLEFILSMIATLGDYTFLLDLFCGIIQWWKLSSMYEDGAMPNMPQINYGVGDREERQRPRANGKAVLFIAKSLLNPIFLGFLCTFSFFGGLVITFWIPHVQQMCVHSTNGTWFANNMLGPFLSNIAMTEGNAQYLLAEHFCYSSRNRLCATIQMEIEGQIMSDHASLLHFQAQHNESSETMELVKDCIHSPNMTAMVDEACCGLKGHRTVGCNSNRNYICPIDTSTTPPSAYRPFATYLESPSCSANLHDLTLHSERLECTNLNEACNHIPCNGVNDEAIQRISRQTDCKVELWIVHSCRFWATAILQFMALYTICSLLYLGCRDLHWRKISPDCIGLRTHLLENGVLVEGRELQERAQMISDEIQWFERKARIQIFLGILLLFFYIVIVVILCVKG